MRAVALRDRWPGVFLFSAFGFGLRKRDEGAVSIAQFAFGERALVQVPPGESGERHGDIREPDAGNLVAVLIDRRHQRPVRARDFLRPDPVAEDRYFVD